MFEIIGFAVIQVVIGLLYSNFLEWALHKYVLHDLGKKFKKVFGFHWFDHHRNSVNNTFYDKDYEKSLDSINSHSKETFGLTVVWAMHFWTFFAFPIFAVTITYCMINYYFTHKWAHQNPEWAKKHLRHHWDHHMGKNQNANYCVTRPWFDYILRTRVEPKPELTLTKITTLNNNITVQTHKNKKTRMRIVK